jgi:hypothetical protein
MVLKKQVLLTRIIASLSAGRVSLKKPRVNRVVLDKGLAGASATLTAAAVLEAFFETAAVQLSEHGWFRYNDLGTLRISKRTGKVCPHMRASMMHHDQRR